MRSEINRDDERGLLHLPDHQVRRNETYGIDIGHGTYHSKVLHCTVNTGVKTLRLYLIPTHGFFVEPALNLSADEPVRIVILLD